MTEHSAGGESLALVKRMQTVFTRSNMDGHCREMLRSAVDRFLALEARRLSKTLLTRARARKERIAAILTLLSELDQLTEDESDRSVFEEFALLFDEISRTAVAGSAALREIDCVKSDFPLDEPQSEELKLLTQWLPQCSGVK
jgi:hypothetical protein